MLIPVAIVTGLIVGQDLGRPAFASPKGAEQQPVEIIARGQTFSSVKAYRSAEAAQADSRLVNKENDEPAMGLIHNAPVQVEAPAGPVSGQSADPNLDERGWKTIKIGSPKDPAKALPADPSGPSKQDALQPEKHAEGVGLVAGVTPPVSEMVKDFQERPVSASEQGEKVQTAQELGEKLASQASKSGGPLLLISDDRKVKLLDLKENADTQRPTEAVNSEKQGLPNP